VDADHDRIEELLAGYVLRSLSGDDAREADRLLSEHVPSCPACRATLNDFQALMGEMAPSRSPRPRCCSRGSIARWVRPRPGAGRSRRWRPPARSWWWWG
jgi:predicted anti-sigma-YlaC factor YlaD